MTYHDTPSQPLAEMRYLDTSAKPAKRTRMRSSRSTASACARQAGRIDRCAGGGRREASETVDGKPTQWHDGFSRYDFVMDEQTLAITAVQAPDGERFAVGAPEKGKRRCVVVAPQDTGRRQPVVVAGMLLGPPAADRSRVAAPRFPHRLYLRRRDTAAGQDVGSVVRLPDRGARPLAPPRFHRDEPRRRVRIYVGDGAPGPVACIYADNPGTNKGVIAKLGLLADRDVPLLHVCGSIDPLLAASLT